MEIKEGVVLAGLQLPMRKVLKEANRIWKSKGRELAITSGLEGTHSAGSYHYFGYALDLRSRYFEETVKREVAKELQAALGPDYFVLLESTHIHAQYNA